MEQNIYLDKDGLGKTENLVLELRASIDIDSLKAEEKEIEKETFQPGFWDDSQATQKLIKKQNQYKEKIDTYDQLMEDIEETEVMIDLMEEEGDFAFYDQFKESVQDIQDRAAGFKLTVLLTGERDDNAAIISIHVGAGGTEAQDRVNVLYRMYRRYGDKKGFKVETLDLLTEDEAGIKSVTMRMASPYVYGYLKVEKGVHRLVRISPFDTAKKRHTSFSSADVYPELDEDIEVDTKDEDLKIGTYRSSGAGGQRVNTTDSAVRITHIPTGIVVQCQNERSQIQNREQAMSILKAKLIALAEEEKKEKIDDLQGNYAQIAWGSQIRPYIFQPYAMVKDHRMGEEIEDVNRVIDGDLDPFINAYLQKTATESKEG